MTECEASRDHVLDSIRGRLDGSEHGRVERHLETCADCRRIFERERALNQVMSRLPTYALPNSLRAQLAARVAPKPQRSIGRTAAILGPSLAATLLVLFLVRGWVNPNQELVTEAVNDHLRVLYAERPIEVESGGIHQVKPWFAGRLDFAPVLSFSGDEEFPMQGGAVALFLDRKAATFIFKHKLHVISLFVFRSEGLSWPLRSNATLGQLPATSSHQRGFNTLFWQEGDLGYALVSDVDAKQLLRLGVRISSH